MLFFILFSFDNFRACITQYECRMCDVYSLKNKHNHTVYYMFQVILYSYPSSLYASPLFSFHSLRSALLLLLQHLLEASGSFGFLLTTSIYTKYTIHIFICTVHINRRARKYHFWRKFILQGRRMSTAEKLFVNSIPFNGLRLFGWWD